MAVQPSGAVTIRCAGIPGEEYWFEVSSDLIDWNILNPPGIEPGQRVVVRARVNGLFEFIDYDAPSHPTRFYRTRHCVPGTP